MCREQALKLTAARHTAGRLGDKSCQSWPVSQWPVCVPCRTACPSQSGSLRLAVCQRACCAGKLNCSVFIRLTRRMSQSCSATVTKQLATPCQLHRHFYTHIRHTDVTCSLSIRSSTDGDALVQRTTYCMSLTCDFCSGRFWRRAAEAVDSREYMQSFYCPIYSLFYLSVEQCRLATGLI